MAFPITVSVTNRSPFPRTGMAELILPLDQGELFPADEGVVQLAAEGTGYLGETTGSERAFWSRALLPEVPYSDGSEEPLRWRRYPDGALKRIAVIFPVTLPPAPNPAAKQYAEQIITIAPGNPTRTREFVESADVTQGRQGARIVMSWQDAKHAREEGTIWLRDGVLIESSEWHRRYHVFGRLGSGAPGDNTPVWQEAVYTVWRDLRHVTLHYAWGWNVAEVGKGRIGGSWPDLGAVAVHPITATIRGEAGVFRDVRIRMEEQKCMGRAAQTVGGLHDVTLTLLDEEALPGGPGVFNWQNVPDSLEHEYEGVLFFGAADDLTAQAEREIELCPLAQNWPGKIMPFGHTPALPAYVSDRADALARLANMVVAKESWLAAPQWQHNPYHSPPYSNDSLDGGGTGTDQEWDGIYKGYEDQVCGSGIRMPILKHAARQWSCHLWGWRYQSGRRVRAADHPGLWFWEGGISGFAADYLGRTHPQAGSNVLLPDPTLLPKPKNGNRTANGQPFSRTWHHPDRQHWTRTWETWTAQATRDWWALQHLRKDAQVWIAMNRVDTESPNINGPGAERGQGRSFAFIGAQLWEALGDTADGAEIDHWIRRRWREQILPSYHGDTIGGKGVGVGTLLKFSAEHTPGNRTALATRTHARAWEGCIWLRGIFGLARTLLATDPNDADGLEMLRIAQEVACTVTRFCFFDGRDSRRQAWHIDGTQTPANNNSVPTGWNDPNLIGATARGAASGATGTIVTTNRGIELYLTNCSGFFTQGETVTVDGFAGMSCRLNHRYVTIAQALQAFGQQAPNQYRPLTEAEHDDAYFQPENPGGFQEHGLIHRNVLYADQFTQDNMVAVFIAREAAQLGLYPPGINAAVLEQSEWIRNYVNQSAFSADGFDFYTGNWTPVIADPFGGTQPSLPNAPTNVQAEGISTTEISVAWQHDGMNVTGFLVDYRLVTSAVWSTAPALGAEARGTVIGGLDEGSTYAVRVRATNATGSSAPSPEDQATTLGAPAPNAPVLTGATGVSPTAIRIDIQDTNSDPNETHTIIEESEDGIAGFAEVGRAPADAAFFVREGLTPAGPPNFDVGVCYHCTSTKFGNQGDLGSPLVGSDNFVPNYHVPGVRALVQAQLAAIAAQGATFIKTALWFRDPAPAQVDPYHCQWPINAQEQQNLHDYATDVANTALPGGGYLRLDVALNYHFGAWPDYEKNGQQHGGGGEWGTAYQAEFRENYQAIADALDGVKSPNDQVVVRYVYLLSEMTFMTNHADPRWVPWEVEIGTFFLPEAVTYFAARDMTCTVYGLCAQPETVMFNDAFVDPIHSAINGHPILYQLYPMVAFLEALVGGPSVATEIHGDFYWTPLAASNRTTADFIARFLADFAAVWPGRKIHIPETYHPLHKADRDAYGLALRQHGNLIVASIAPWTTPLGGGPSPRVDIGPPFGLDSFLIDPGVTRFYRARAAIGSRESANSNVVQGTTLPGGGGGQTAPEAPTGFAIDQPATASDALSMRFTPAASGDPAASFEIQLALSESGPWLTRATIPATGSGEHQATIGGLDDNTTYWGRVRGLNGAGAGAFSNTDSGATLAEFPTVPPDPPADFTATAIRYDRVHITCTLDGNETGVQYQRRNVTANGDWAQIARLGAGGDELTDEGLEPETQYEYRARAEGKDGFVSDWSISSEVTMPERPTASHVPPNPVALLTVGSIGSHDALATWADTNAAPANEDGHVVQLQEVPDGIVKDGEWVTLGLPPADATSFHLTDLLPERIYAVRVAAHREGLLSAWTGPVLFQTDAGAPPTPPNAPTDLATTTVGPTSADLSFTDTNADEDGYLVEASSDGGASWRRTHTLAANVTTFTLSGLAPKTSHQVRVQAVRGAAVSTYATLTFSTTVGAPVGGAPPGPSRLILRARPQGRLLATWQNNHAPTLGVLGIRVEKRDLAGEAWTVRATLAADAESYEDSGLRPGEHAVYRVVVFTATDEAASNLAQVTAPYKIDRVTFVVDVQVAGFQVEASN